MESVPSLPDVILGASVYKSGDTSYIYVEQQDAALVFILLATAIRFVELLKLDIRQ